MFCSKCGNEISNGETSCAECGTPLMPSAQQQPYYQPVHNTGNCTSIGGWIGWWLLSFILPVIGWIIAICVTKDQSVKNGIVAYIIFEAILLVLFVVLAILGVFSAADLFR